MNEPRILILTPFRNEEASIPFYMNALEALDYPRDKLSLYWLQNDSSDNTSEILGLWLKARQFGKKLSIRLCDATIIGPVDKQPPGGYVKDIPYGPQRGPPWSIIWNEYFLPAITRWDGEYVIVWMADCVPPPDAIWEYLKVFETHTDAGWVGGAYHRRYPRHQELQSPIGLNKRGKFHTEATVRSITKPIKCRLICHFWMMKAAPLCTATFSGETQGIDVHMCLAKHFEDHGLYVYYQPSVYVKHVSSDGKIYRESL